MDLKLYERELIAIDGSKFRAVNGRKKMYNEEILKKKLVRIEENMTHYLNELDYTDQRIRKLLVILPEKSNKSWRN